MGCNSSKISSTHVEIIRKRQEVKSYIKWWKRKKKEAAERPKSGLGNNSLPRSPANSPESSSEDGSKELDRRTGQVIEEHKATESNRQDRLPRNQTQHSRESLGSCENFLLSASGGSDDGKSFHGLGDSRPPSGRKSRMANDLTVKEIEDSSDLSDGMEELIRPRTGTSTPTVGYHVPLIVHSAWSDLSVRQKNTFCVPKTNVNKFRGSRIGNVDGSPRTNRRNRPMAAKGERHKPELTEIYGAELSIPGIPVPNPKREQEESCLNAWMARRLGDEC